MARDNSAVYQRRQEIAREHGFRSYGEARRWRARARNELQEQWGVTLPTGRAMTAAIDKVATTMKVVEDAAKRGEGSGLSGSDLYDPFKGVYEEFFDSEDESVIWEAIRDWYPSRK